MTVRMPSTSGWRDVTLFLTGIGLIIHEATIYHGPERWGLIMLYAGMVGMPLVLRADEKRENDRPEMPPVPEDARSE